MEALASSKDAVKADGAVEIPIDLEAFGLWLKAAFNHRTRVSTLPKTDTVQSDLLTTTARLVAYQCARRHALRAGPATFSPFNGRVKCKNTVLGILVSAKITFSNTLTGPEQSAVMPTLAGSIRAMPRCSDGLN